MPFPEQQQPTILIVDDEPLMLELTSTYLETMGCRVLTASNGKIALEILAQEPVRLVLSDVNMALLNGYELAAEVRRLYPSVPIQLMSGFEGEVRHDVFDQKLHDQLIHKPFRLEDLWERIESIIHENGNDIVQLSERRSNADRRESDRRNADRRCLVKPVVNKRRTGNNRRTVRRAHSRRI